MVGLSCAKVPGRTDMPVSLDQVAEGETHCMDRLRLARLQGDSRRDEKRREVDVFGRELWFCHRLLDGHSLHFFEGRLA
jgi:hypothetical protein